MELRIRNTAFTIKILGWLQIVGGITGIGSVSWLTINVGDVNGAVLFIILTGYLLNVLSITAGVKLLDTATLKLGMILSIVNNCIQIVQFRLFGYAFTFSSGAAISIGIHDGLKFNFAIVTSDFNMAINTDDRDFLFMINILAVIIAAALFDIWTELFRTSKDNEADTEVDRMENVANTGL